MTTFKSKPEFVEALQFTGSDESAKEVAAFSKAHVKDYDHANLRRGRTDYDFNAENPTRVDPDVYLNIFYAHRSITLYLGYWIVLKQDGFVTAMSDEYFKKKYEQV